MDHIDKLESQSIFMIREAYKKFKNIALLWSMGKDATTLLWLIRKAFYGKIPFPIIHIDTGHKFPEMYKFREKWTKEWNLDLIIAQNKEAIERGVICAPGDTHACTTELKTKALQMILEKHKFQALIVGIRRDEHGIRAKERHFSPRNKEFKWDYKNQPLEIWNQYKIQTENKDSHLRVHPLLGWTELDIWLYMKREGIPINELYLAKNGKRFRSLGCKPTTTPIDSEADTIDKIIEELKTTKQAERAGRALDKETMYEMERLRALGYM